MTFINSNDKKCGLIIGINYRGDKKAKLNGCINDAKRTKEFIINRCNYLEDSIEIVTEDEKVIPTKKNIIESIKRLVYRVKSMVQKKYGLVSQVMELMLNQSGWMKVIIKTKFLFREIIRNRVLYQIIFFIRF